MSVVKLEEKKKRIPLGQGNTPVGVLAESPMRFKKDVKPKDLAEIIYLLLKVDSTTGTKAITYSALNGRASGNYRARSIQDAFRLAKHYIPSVSYIKVKKAITELSVYRNTPPVCSHSFCGTCRREVYRLNNLNATEESVRERLGEYNIKIVS